MVLQGALVFFEKGCQYCHGIKGEGGIRGRDLTDAAARLRESILVARIFVPPAGMPSYANNMEPGELEALVAFLRAVAGVDD